MSILFDDYKVCILRSGFSKIILVGVAFLVAGGCSSNPTPADVMTQHAVQGQTETDLARQLARDWEKGAELARRGEQRLKDGEKRVKAAESEMRRGREDIRRGQREIAEGQKMMSESKKKFQVSFPGIQVD